MNRILTLLSIFVLCFISISGQNFKPSDELNDEKVLMLLPDSCFFKLNRCLHDSTAFLLSNRHKIIDTLNPPFSGDLKIYKDSKNGKGFILNANTCKYSTTMKFNWWFTESKKALIIVVIEEVDMCTERQQRYFYEYSNSPVYLRAVNALPRIPITEFVTSKTLRLHKIDPNLKAPIFANWNDSDTLTVSLVTAPYRNCADSYEDSPFTKLKKTEYYRSEMKFCRKKDLFLKCK